MNIADILDKAADLIEPEGAWTQDSPGDRVTSFCLSSALGTAAGDDGYTVSDGFRAARAVLVSVLPESGLPLVTFNDAPERTQAEVVAKLREAARLARERGK